jgi:hypothetical protein
MAEIIEATDGKKRDKPINDKLRRVLDRAADAATIETVLVTSGGQAAKGSGGKRTGSTRHDHGNAADLQLLKSGRALDFTLPDDRPIVKAFVTSAAARGATGIGAGVEYMGPKTLHVGFGRKSVWGKGGRAANAPTWLKQAVLAGWENPGSDTAADALADHTHVVDEDEIDGDRLSFTGPALPLSDGDVSLVAGYLGCHLAALRAVIAVESRAKAFGPDGRPIILYEPHIFWRELGAGVNRDKAVKSGLAYKKRGTKPYKKTQAARYKWLEKAIEIDETAALCSCSWGIGQVMGFNYGSCGFSTVQNFVEAMTKSEGAQLYAMARFIVSNRLQEKLKTQDWSGFARVYNGKDYAKDGYHTKLKNAYVRRPASEKVVPPEASEADIRTALVDIASDETAKPKPADRGETPLNPEVGPGERQVIIARRGLNLRSGNSSDFEILRTLPFGTEVHVLARSGDWAQVDLQGDGKADGFMFASFLRPPSALPDPGPDKPENDVPPDDQIADLLSKLSDFIARLRK